jgi:hypothetical protein
VPRHLDGADPAGRAGHGHPQRRHRPGRGLSPAPRGRMSFDEMETLLTRLSGLTGLAEAGDVP